MADPMTGHPAAEMLQALGFNRDDYVSVCWKKHGAGNNGSLPHKVVPCRDVADEVTYLGEKHDVWIGANPVRPDVQKRGTRDDVIALRALHADLDDDKFEDGRAGVDAVIDDLTVLLGQRPNTVVMSGHGKQPRWKVTIPGNFEVEAAQRILNMFGDVVRLYAGMHGGKVDSVFDLSRILRAPGTVNGKAEPIVTLLSEVTNAPPIGLSDLIRSLKSVLEEPAPAAAAKSLVPEEVRISDAFEAQVARDHVEYQVGLRLRALRDSQVWEKDSRDHVDRGWEKLTADVAQTLLTLVDEDWNHLPQEELRHRFLEAAPTDKTWTAEDNSAKWASQRGRAIVGPGRIPPPPLALYFGPSVDYGFWGQRESLATIHQWARHRLASPWGTLGVALARVLASIPSGYVLPPLVGGHGSLNFFVALVGPSGGGKGAATSCAAYAVDVGDIYVNNLGSGEGIVKQYRRRQTAAQGGGIEILRDSVLFNVPEIDSLAAVGSRSSATLMPMVRQAWSGEHLGFAYADDQKSITVPAHQYRLAAVVGVQPLRASAILDDADGGTPQRFLWLPVLDPSTPEEEFPEPPVWELAHPVNHHCWGDGMLIGDRRAIPVPDETREAVRAARIATMRGQGDPLDGHALQTRMKVMVALAVLEGRRVPVLDDWRVAGQVMKKSDETRAAVQRQLSEAAMEKVLASGRIEAVRADTVDEVRYKTSTDRVAARVLKQFTSDWRPMNEVRKAMASRDRQWFEGAVDALVTAGNVEIRDVDGGRLGRLK